MSSPLAQHVTDITTSNTFHHRDDGSTPEEAAWMGLSRMQSCRVMEKREEFPGRAGPWEEAGRREWS